MELNERLCHYCVKCPYVLVLETAQNADVAQIKNLSSLLPSLDISPPSDVYEH